MVVVVGTKTISKRKKTVLLPARNEVNCNSYIFKDILLFVQTDKMSQDNFLAYYLI